MNAELERVRVCKWDLKSWSTRVLRQLMRPEGMADNDRAEDVGKVKGSGPHPTHTETPHPTRSGMP